MNKDLKLRLKSGILALMLVGGIKTATLPKVNAEDIKVTYKQGTFIDSDEIYGKYVVKENDNLSRISQKICKYYGVEITTKYWPVLAYLNEYPRVIQPGDIIIFPNSIEEMIRLLIELKNNNWTNSYVYNNNIYKEHTTYTVKDLIREIYGTKASNDPEFIKNYLKVQGLTRKYNENTIIENSNQLFELTEWIPTLDELNYSQKRK